MNPAWITFIFLNQSSCKIQFLIYVFLIKEGAQEGKTGHNAALV